MSRIRTGKLMETSRTWWMVWGSVMWLAVGAPAHGQEGRSEASEVDAISENYIGRLGETLTLDQLLSRADQGAPEIREADERQQLGEAERAGAEIAQPFNPEVESRLGVGTAEGEVRKVEVTLKQRLEVAGERGRRIEAARRHRGTLEARRDRARRGVRLRVRRLYRLALVERRRVELEQRVAELTGELLEIARQRLEAGEEGQSAVLVARAESATARQQLVARWQRYLRRVGQLATTIGWEAATPPEPTGELADPEPAPPRDELVERAVERDPTLEVLRARRDEIRARRAVARRAVWPDPLVGLGFERQRIGTDRAGNKVLFVVGLPLPFWERNQGEIARQTARERVIEQQIANRKRTLENRIAEHVADIEAAHRQIRIVQTETLPAIEEQFELLREGFELGEMDVLEVMNARDRLLEARRRYLETLAEYVSATGDLEQLLGEPVWGESS